MKCVTCGAETEKEVKYCTKCGAPMEAAESQEPVTEGEKQAPQAEETGWVNPADVSVSQSEQAEPAPVNQKPECMDAGGGDCVSAMPPAPNKKFTKTLTIVIAILAVVSIGALAFVKLTTKDPKQVVIDAFGNIWPEDQVLPSEELFGFREFADSVLTADSEAGITLKMDSCSDAGVNQFAGSGLRFVAKYDRTNNKSSANAGVIYSGMDLLNLNAYYFDETLMVSAPELTNQVFTIDLSEGLGERIAESPYIGPMIEARGIDLQGFADYFFEMIAEAEQTQEEGKIPFDLAALMNRYKEGCKAQENFKAALIVEKAEKGTYTMDGKEVSCKGYNVTVSKDSMIEFLETSSDFFLQDETLKRDFLKQMESTVRMTELMGGSVAGMPSAQSLQEQSYEEAKKAVDKMTDYLDESLTDIQMTVYVDKKGNLAAVEGTTQMYPKQFADEDEKNVDISFSWQLQGGSYLTQNFKGNITFEYDDKEADLDIIRQGFYDGKKLTDDISVEINTVYETYDFAYSSSYDSDGGSYHTSAEFGGGGVQFAKASISGVLDEFERGKSFHMDIDALEISALDNAINMVFSGEYYYQPLEGEVTAPEGERIDILAVTESDWNSVITEILFNGMSIFSQMGVSIY